MAISDIVTFSRASSGTYFDANGVMQTAGNDVMRLDHDPVTKQPLGVLIEEARTNQIWPYDNQASGSWQKIRSSVSGSRVVKGINFQKFIPNTDLAASHQVNNNFSLPALAADTPVTEKILVLIEDPLAIRFSLRIFDTTGFISYIGYDTTNPGVISGVGVALINSAWLTPLGDNVWEAGVTYTARAGSTAFGLQFFAANPVGGNVTNYDWDGTSGYWLGAAQVEVNALFPTSYIPTTTAPATRAADRLSVAIGDWAGNNLKGSLLVDAIMRNPGNATTANLLPHIASFQKDVSLSGDYRALRIAQPRTVQGIVGNNGTFTSANNLVVVEDGQRFRAALAGEGSNIVAVANGGTIRQITDRQWGSDNNTLFIGSQGGSTRFFNGHIRSVSYFPRRLPDAELQAATVLS